MAAPVAEVPGFGYGGLKVQAAIGTGVTPSQFGALKSMTPPKPMIKSVIAGDGTSRDNTISFKNTQYAQGDFETYITPVFTSYALGLLLSGADAITGAGDPYLHTIPTAAGTLYPFTFEAGVGGLGTTYIDVLRVIDAYMKQGTITFGSDKEPTAKFAYEGITLLPEASATAVTFETDRQMVNADLTSTFTGLDVDGIITAGTIDIKVNNQVIGNGAGLAPIIVPGKREIDVTFDAAVTDKKVLREIFGGTAAATVALKVLTQVTSWVVKWDLAGSPDHFLSLTLSAIDMTDVTPTFDYNGKVFEMKGCKGKATLTGGTAALVLAASNATAAAYWT